jgi:hypothetical protein
MSFGDWRQWSRPRLEAELAMDGQRLVSDEDLPHPLEVTPPTPYRADCICGNGHEPDAEGLIYTSPSCEVHGLGTGLLVTGKSTNCRPRGRGKARMAQA